MTKQEYEASKVIIKSDKTLGQTNKFVELLYLADEYIKSLEAENSVLTAKNAKLEKLNSAALERLSYHACPAVPSRNNYGQPCSDDDDCVACWREYLGGKDE